MKEDTTAYSLWLVRTRFQLINIKQSIDPKVIYAHTRSSAMIFVNYALLLLSVGKKATLINQNDTSTLLFSIFFLSIASLKNYNYHIIFLKFKYSFIYFNLSDS